ncbi:DUF7344 domain-containing protein [Halosimplex pelagicum]|uniref:DUF7344 domain-containing protein n=1 Tax=Halosimplex pelagicum TaxID=869886 RepID=A0A7D5SYA5_9EURY|nr:hypothetical protein [Halosimplex pelagicum]QLH84647.1 hypothetical protein HZS54_24715 [Halosimplex pelagicum]
MATTHALDSDRTRDRDRLFRGLAARRRRAALRVLRASNAATVVDLAEAIGTREAAADAETDRDAHTSAVEAALHHRHLPVLVEAGLVDRRDDGSVTLTAEGRTAVEWLDEPMP